jgi:hypothetical protein
MSTTIEIDEPVQPESLLALVCRICDERMLTTAGNFDLHTSLCAEAQQIADNVEASTDERIVLLMRHLRHHMPRSRSRERALPILDHLQVSFVQLDDFACFHWFCFILLL